jgi:hypothetical protein
MQEIFKLMQIGNKGTDVTVSGTAGSMSAFKIAATGGAFDILSSGLYNDKIRAVIREVSCNAWDAQIAAGKGDIPFEVHLPTNWEPYFSVKDNGTGLKFVSGGCETCHGTGVEVSGACSACNGTGDFDSLMQLYCTYFSSDKDQSNALIGGFGLGSKSPFAYTNKRLPDGSFQSGGFDVTNRYNGKKYFYSALVKLGIPSVVLMQVIDTDEPNGVEVQFPVDIKDIWEFENKAALVFEFFEPKPILNKDILIHVSSYSVKTESWGMRQDENGLRAIMGNVQYTVGNIDTSRLSEAQLKIATMPIDLFFNIGELHPAVSREALQLDDTTVANLLKRLDLVQSNLMDEVRKKVDACTTGWEARLKIHELTMQAGIGALVNDAFNKGLLFGKYKDFKLDTVNTVINELDYNNITLVQYNHTDRKRRKAIKDVLFEASGAKRPAALQNVASGLLNKTDFDIKITVGSDVIFVINDLKTTTDKYVNYMLQSDPNTAIRKVIVISRINKSVTMDKVIDDTLVLLGSIDNPPSVKASDLKIKYDLMMKEEKITTAYTRQARMDIRILNNYTYYRYSRLSGGWRRVWSRGDDKPELRDSTVTKFYVKIDKYLTPSNILSLNARELTHLVQNVRESGLFGEINNDTPIFAVRDNSKFLLDPSFVELIPYLKTTINDILTPAKKMEMSLAFHPFSSHWDFLLKHVVEYPHVLEYDSAFRKFALDLHQAKTANRKDYAILVDIARKLDVDMSTSNMSDYGEMWNKLLEHYPILNICRRSGWDCVSIDEINTFVDYLQYVDSKSKEWVISNVSLVETEEEETINA